jgi:hypothetical protein
MSADSLAGGPNDRARSCESAPVRPVHGLGILAGYGACALVGLADGTRAVVRSPRISLGVGDALVAIAHCVSSALLFGLLFGAAQELFLAAARRVPLLRHFGSFALAGPRRWFAHAPKATLGTLCALAGLAIAIGPVFPATFLIETTFHSRVLAATAIFLVTCAMLAIGGMTVIAIAPALRWIVERAGKHASPGAAVSLALVVAALETGRIARINHEAFSAFDKGFFWLPLLFAVSDLTLLYVLARRHRRGPGVSRRWAAPAWVSVGLVAGMVSVATVAMRPTASRVVFERTSVAGPWIRVVRGPFARRRARPVPVGGASR